VKVEAVAEANVGAVAVVAEMVNAAVAEHAVRAQA
jgi:hypothetical protein